LASVAKIFASLRSLAQSDLIGFRIRTMLETLILQGYTVREPIGHTMTNQKIASVGTVFASYPCQ